MKRIALLGPVPGVPWDAQVLDAVCRGESGAVIKLVSQYGGVRRLREGFTVRGQNGTTFARLCLQTQAIPVLRALVEAAPGGVTLQDCCTFHLEDPSGLTIPSDMVLHEEALNVEHPSAEAMALALAQDPDHPCLTVPLDRFDGASLHCEALKCATQNSRLAKVKVWAECARLLMEFGAPIAHRSAAYRSTAAHTFFGHQWSRNDGIPEVLAELLQAYVKSGVVDVDAPDAFGSVPLQLAIVTGNGHAAAAAIDLGCDLEKAVPARYADLLDLARSFEDKDPSGNLVPLVTEALLRRKLRDLDASGAGAADGAPVPAPRRAQRAHI